MLSILKENNIPVILSRIASNLKDQPPLISAKTKDYPDADEVFCFANETLKNGNRKKADSLFRLAKDLDALKFRAPEKINDAISDLGAKYNYRVIPVDSIFNSVSPDGIVGNNLMVDHLHPNLKGYQLIGKTIYECMDRMNYLPKSENPKFPLFKQDSITIANFVFSRLDSVMGNYSVSLLKCNWPFAKKNLDLENFQHSDFMNFFKPKDFIDSIAVFRIEGMSWSDAHLLAAKTYLLKDDIKNYLKHIDILLNQYPLLGDFNSLITYFYYRNKIDLIDYSTKRVGIIQFYRGKTDEAIGYLEKTYQYFPKDIQVLYYLSFSYFKKNNYEAALKKINECLSVKPDYSEAVKLKQEILKKI
ncbi:MAG: tetratricopeptide repeat protein [Ignavibacteria bacterium]|nr:tetratricopeptide repeat protein [Ignavibacteria bacterium]